MVHMHDNIVGIDAAIFMHPTTWKASGHVDAFSDPHDRQQRFSKKRYRADNLIEDHIWQKLRLRINKEVDQSPPNVSANAFDAKISLPFYQSAGSGKSEQKYDAVNDRMNTALEWQHQIWQPSESQLIEDLRNRLSRFSGTRNWTEVRQFNLMFSYTNGQCK
jgi:glycyl-tRNA synthetase